MIIFAHGSGSSRFSPRNNYVAKVLRSQKLGTLLMDLMTPEEDTVYERRFDIDLLTKRLISATKWLKEQDDTRGLSTGYFGASTGASAAIQAAAILGGQIGAIVSRCGRPDLATDHLEAIKSPTLLIVGGNNELVVELNR